MKTSYEYAVLGCGGIGSGAVYWLSRLAGAEVLGLEQFRLGHDNGGSQDHSRIIRLAYHAPEYTRLTPHTYSAWNEVEQDSGIQLVFKTGGLDLGPINNMGGRVVDHYADAMRAADIPFDELTASEVMERFPQFRLPDTIKGLYQRDSGLVDARKANATHITLARARGATVLDNTPVRAIRPISDTGVEIETDAGTFNVARLVVAAGSWTSGVLSQVGIDVPITVTREQVTYFQTPHLRDFAPDRFPIWIWHDAGAEFYGFPVYGEVATKAGQDVGGDVVTTETRTFDVNPRADAALRRFLGEYIPGFMGPDLYTKTCLYDMPPDRNFIIDQLPEHPQITVLQGAAHGFKFASLLGRIGSQLASEGKTAYPIESFRLNRPALTDPTYPKEFQLQG